MSAVVAAGAGKAVGEDAALQIFLERFAHVGLGAVVVALTTLPSVAGWLLSCRYWGLPRPSSARASSGVATGRSSSRLMRAMRATNWALLVANSPLR